MTAERISRNIVFSLLVIGVSVFSWTVLSGLVYGFFYGVFEDPSFQGFVAHGPNFYQEHNRWYLQIIFLNVVFIVTKAIDSRVGSYVGVLLFCISVFPFLNMVTLKLSVLELELCCENYPWLQSTLYLDLFSAGLTALLLGLELLSILKGGSKMETITKSAL